MAKIKLRRDTAANWTSTNPTLAAGEPGYETDTKKIKYGDGTTAWTSLGYAIPTFTIGTEGTASGDGSIAYNSTTAVLTYTPPAYIGLTSISVGTEAVASGDGGIAYNNTTGVFTYTPPTALGIGAVSLTAISVGAEASASGDGGIAYNNTTGVFTYTPPLDITGNAATATTATTLTSLTASITELNYNDITTLGTVQASKTVTADASNVVLFPDNAKASFGTVSDLQIYHDGTHSYIDDTGTGNLKITASQIGFGSNGGADVWATFVADGACTFYYDNSLKLETTNTGASVTGNLIVNGSEDLADAGAASLALNASYFTTVAAETATLAAGTAGQIKTFMMAGSAGNMVITVTNPGWGGAGTITFSAVGQGCTLQYVNSKWFCIGNNGASFA